MDWKLELVTIPVTDVDRAKAFYTEKAGFHADHDHHVSDELRFVQLTPPGSACSIAFGTGLSDSEPGSAQGFSLSSPTWHAAREELVGRGLDVGEVGGLPLGIVRVLPRPRRQSLGRAAATAPTDRRRMPS